MRPKREMAVVRIRNGEHIYSRPSGPCMLCGRLSPYRSCFADDAFVCEYVCGRKMPHGFRQRERRLREVEQRQYEAELDNYENGYEADDENDLINHWHGCDEEHQLINSGLGPIEKASGQPMSGRGVDVDVVFYPDPEDVDVYAEMQKTMFPEGIPLRPFQPTKPRCDVAAKKHAATDVGVRASSPDKRIPESPGKDNKQDRPSKKQKVADGPATSVSAGTPDHINVEIHHSLPGQREQSSL